MAHFAKIENGIVTQVIVADIEFIESGILAGEWIQTSYNTEEGKYKIGKDDSEKNINKLKGTIKDIKARERKNYAGIGFSYDSVDDAFYPPQPFNSWKLNKQDGKWEAPKKMPNDGQRYLWKEDLLEWVIDIQ